MMIYKPKGRRYYSVKFSYRGKVIRKATRATDKRTARSIESTIKAELAKGDFGILEHKAAPMLCDFLKNDFLPFIDTKLPKKATRDYYHTGSAMLSESDLGKLLLDEINDQRAAQFAARKSYLSPSSINCPLRTLRRALKLAYEWGKITHPIKITLAKGEHQRDRIVSLPEFLAYRELCRQPWRDIATLLYGTAMRPGEAYTLRWEHVLFGSDKSFIQIAEGKSKAARRLLPMLPEVHQMLFGRWEKQDKPAEGWVFPSGSQSGHEEKGSAKNQHHAALRSLRLAHDTVAQWNKDGCHGEWQDAVQAKTKLSKDYISRHSDVLLAGVKPFPPYCLRHTALTRLGERCDAFTLAKIAGHSSITITQRYIHPQADAIERAFKSLDREHQEVVNEAGHRENAPTVALAREAALAAIN